MENKTTEQYHNIYSDCGSNTANEYSYSAYNNTNTGYHIAKTIAEPRYASSLIIGDEDQQNYLFIIPVTQKFNRIQKWFWKRLLGIRIEDYKE